MSYWKLRPLVCLLSLALVLATLAVYARGLRHDFVPNHDDNLYVTENAHVLRGLTLDGLRWSFNVGYGANWHPLTWVSHMADVQLYGKNPVGHHLTNLLLHIANTLLLFWLLKAWTGAVWRSALVAALFALHPLHVESVAWVAERKDVLSGLFFMLTLAAYGWYTRRPSVWRYGLVALLLALGLMAKPMLVTLPLVLVIVDYWPLGRSAQAKGRTWWWLIIEKLPLLALAAGASVLTVMAQRQAGAVGSLARFPLEARIGNALVAYVGYLQKTLWPTGLAAIYPHPGTSLLAWKVALAGALVVGVTFAAVALRRKRPYLLAGWAWYVLTLVPVIGLVQVGEQSMADRYTYLPLIGIFVAVVWGVWGVGEFVPCSVSRVPCREESGLEIFGQGTATVGRCAALAAGAVAGVVLVALAGCAFVQVGYWRDSATVFQRAMQAVPGNYFAYHEYGVLMSQRGYLASGRTYFQTAVAIRPDWGPGHNTLARAYLQSGDYAAAWREVRLARRHGFEPSPRMIQRLSAKMPAPE